MEIEKIHEEWNRMADLVAKSQPGSQDRKDAEEALIFLTELIERYERMTGERLDANREFDIKEMDLDIRRRELEQKDAHDNRGILGDLIGSIIRIGGTAFCIGKLKDVEATAIVGRNVAWFIQELFRPKK